MKMPWSRYLVPLLFLGALVYIAFEPVDEADTIRQLRVDYVDPSQNQQSAMNQMHRETTQLKYMPDEPKDNKNDNKHVAREYKYLDHVDPFPNQNGNDGSEESPSGSSSITIASHDESVPKEKSKLGDHTSNEEDEEDPASAKQQKVARSNLQTEQAKRDKLFYNRNKHILTLGGSTTWGSKLEKRESAYPYLLPKILGTTWRVTNLAVRATDASYASQCIESMIRENSSGGKTEKDVEFDVILLEYSLNGLDGMPLLVQRLRQRYPQAIIIYIHLWSLRMTVDNAVTGEKPREELNKGMKFKDADASINAMLGDTSTTWTWAPKMKADSDAIALQAKQHVTGGAGGYLYSVPMPESPQIAFTDHWFGLDYHHLSEYGHDLVAQDIAKLLLDESIMAGQTVTDIHDVQVAEHVGTWGAGDHCYSWYETGHHPDVQVDGGTMKMFVKPDKYAVNVGLSFGQPATFTFPNRKPVAQPVMLMIMSWGPGVYPKSQIDLVSPGFDNQTSTLDPLHPNPLNHVFHVTRTAHVGWANHNTAKSSITVNPLEDKQRPLRVIGIVMCGACLEMDDTYLSNDSTHQRLGGTMPRPTEVVDDQPDVKQHAKQPKKEQPVTEEIESQEPKPEASKTTTAQQKESDPDRRLESQESSEHQLRMSNNNDMAPHNIQWSSSDPQSDGGGPGFAALQQEEESAPDRLLVRSEAYDGAEQELRDSMPPQNHQLSNDPQSNGGDGTDAASFQYEEENVADRRLAGGDQQQLRSGIINMPPHRRSSDPQNGAAASRISYDTELDPKLLPHRERRTSQLAKKKT